MNQLLLLILKLDEPCDKIYIGSTQNPYSRWSTHKNSANFPEGKNPLKKKKPASGLAKHFLKGCPNDKGQSKHTLTFTLLDYYDTTDERLDSVGHLPGPQCRCQECDKLKSLEDRWILKVGSFYGKSGLNERDEIVNKTRCNWKK